MEFHGILDQVNVARDMEAMAAFYRRLGLTLGTGSPERAPHHLDGEAPTVPRSTGRSRRHVR